jgi:hypothetical protein
MTHRPAPKLIGCSVKSRSGPTSLRRTNLISNWPEVSAHREASTASVAVHFRRRFCAFENRTSLNVNAGLQANCAVAEVATPSTRLATSASGMHQRMPNALVDLINKKCVSVVVHAQIPRHFECRAVPSGQPSTERRSTIRPHLRSDFRNVKLNLLETIATDCDVQPSSIVGARRPPASQDGSPSKFCSQLEVVRPRGAEHLDGNMRRISQKNTTSFCWGDRGSLRCACAAERTEASR